MTRTTGEWRRHLTIRAERWPYIWAAIVVVLLVALGGMTLAYVAQRQASSTASCLQSTLQDRSGPTAQDQAAHVRFAQALDGLFGIAQLKPAQQQAEIAEFKASVDAYVKQLVADQKARDAKPFKRC